MRIHKLTRSDDVRREYNISMVIISKENILKTNYYFFVYRNYIIKIMYYINYCSYKIYL
jgi:hypothetical protein